MPKPYEFKSEEELVKALASQKTLDKAKTYFEMQSPTIRSVVITGVAGNTFRAFRNLPVQPSVTFRQWAEKHLNNTHSSLIKISSNTGYSNYVHESTLNLCSEWKSSTNSEIGYGRGAKLFNLILKKFACFESLTQAQKSSLIALQHVPLDSYTIVGLRAVRPKLSIPRNATMNYIQSPEQYLVYQHLISEIACKAGVPAIYYDILAWDMSH